jgi:mannose-6-phosphate isomerase
MNLLPPLKFTPIIKPLPWGGRNLEKLFHKVLPPGVPCGESWEIVDLPREQSVVAEGPLASTSLSSILNVRGEELLGESPPMEGRFPALFKLIDARETLSVQVHPDENACSELGAGARPKNEAWYILQASLNARVYVGLKEGIGHSDFLHAIHAGNLPELLHSVEVKTGDFIYLPAGTLHAIGEGIVLAEIQQSSDTTFRVFDWNRLGLDGKPRTLHIEQAFVSIHFDVRGIPPFATPRSGRPGIRCRNFSMEKLSLSAPGVASLDAGRPRILCCIEGSGQITDTGASPVSLSRGETCLVPAAAAGRLESSTGGVFLIARV